MKRLLSFILPLFLLGVFVNAASQAQAASTTFPNVNAKGELTWRGGTYLWYTGTPSLTGVTTDHKVYKFNTTTGLVEQTFDLGPTAIPYGITYQGPNVWVAVGDSFAVSPKLVKIDGSNVLSTFTIPTTNQMTFALMASDGTSVWAANYNNSPATVVRVSNTGSLQAEHSFPANEGAIYKVLYHDSSIYGFPVVFVARNQSFDVLRADTLAVVTTIPNGGNSFGLNDDLVSYNGPSGTQTGYYFDSDVSGGSILRQFGPSAFGYSASSGSRSISLAVDSTVSPAAVWRYNSTGQFEVYRAYCSPDAITTVATSSAVNRFLVASGTLWATATDGTLLKMTGFPAYATSCAAPVQSPITITAGPTVTQLSTTSVRINWTTGQSADSEVDYGVTSAYTLPPVTDASLVTNHAITLTGLNPGQTYHYRVQSRATGFSDAQSADQTFATTLATISISNVQVTNIGAFSATVSWQTNVSTSTNFVSRGFATTSATNGTTHSATLTGLTSSTPYTVTLSSQETGYTTAQTTTSFTTVAPYSVSSTPTGTQSVNQGALATFTVTVTPASDFSFASLSIATNPALANSTQTFNPTSITPAQKSSTLTFTTTSLTIGNTYTVPVDVTCASCTPSFTSSTTVSFRVTNASPACQLALTPPTTNVISGATGTLQLQLTSLNGFGSQVNLTNISPSPAYPAGKVSFNTFMGGGFPSNQGVTIDTNSVAQGSYQVKFHAFDPNSSVACDSQAVMVTVGPPDFTITAVPTTLTVAKNQPADYVFQVRPIGTFSGSVQVSILPPNTGTAWPAGSFAPSSGSFNGAFGDLSVRVNTTSIAQGTYWAKVRATSGSITHEIDPVELIVGPPGKCTDGTDDQSCNASKQWCDLSVSSSVSNSCVTNGQHCTYTCPAPQTCSNTSGACIGDTSAPIISQLQCLPDVNSATIKWTTDEAANSEVLWRPASVQPPYPGATLSDPVPPGTTSHVVPIQPLQTSTQYFVKVKSTDVNGNVATSAEIPCTTLAAADTQQPVVQITFPSSGATITGSSAVRATATDNNGVVKVDFYYNGTNLISTDLSSPYEVNWSVVNLTSGTYALTAKATDAAGNVGVSPQVNVTVNNDTNAPVLSNFLPRRTAPNQYTVTWTTNESATSWVYYCVEPTDGGPCVYNQREPVNSGTSFSTTHRIVLDNLLLNRNYRLTPISCDAAGNCNKPKPF